MNQKIIISRVDCMTCADKRQYHANLCMNKLVNLYFDIKDHDLTPLMNILEREQNLD